MPPTPRWVSRPPTSDSGELVAVRVLVLTTSERYTPGVRLLAALAAGLGARGDVIAVACLSQGEVEHGIAREWPRLSHRAIVGAGFVRRTASFRAIVMALRPDAVLVGSATDASIASVAVGARGGVVRRFTVSETAAVRAGDTRLAEWRPRLARARYAAWGTQSLVVSWPAPTGAAESETVADPAVRLLSVAPPHLLVVSPGAHDATVAVALRAAARVRRQMPALRVTVLGEPATLQATRVHAAALELTGVLTVRPLESLLHYARPDARADALPDALRDAVAVWNCADDDEGAITTIAAMQQGLPVFVPADAPFAALVEPGVTGFHVRHDGGPSPEGARLAATEPSADAVAASELLRLLGDPDWARRVASTAAAWVRERCSWDALVDDAARRLAQVAGVTTSRTPARPSLTPT